MSSRAEQDRSETTTLSLDGQRFPLFDRDETRTKRAGGLEEARFALRRVSKGNTPCGRVNLVVLRVFGPPGGCLTTSVT